IPIWLILRDVEVLQVRVRFSTGKIVFENEAPRTATLSPLVSLIVGEPSVYKAHKTKQPSENSESCSRGG
ncbi:MAG: hypothetical protein II560_05780, partial [Bacteroidales bacterium]|nr:hypothetical protein [Bacteroidales bacterium]